MSLLFCESFDTLTSSTLGKRFSGTSFNNNVLIDNSVYRTGSQSLKILRNNANGYISIPVTANPFIIGFAVKYTEALSFNSSNALISAHSLNGQQVRFVNSSTGLLHAYGSALLATSSETLNIDTWYYIEAKITVANSLSSDQLVLRKNELEIINPSSGDSQQQSTSDILYVNITAFETDAITYYDDLYICDTNGSTCNDFLGDIKVETLYPNGNGNSSQFVGSDADSTDNYLLVDEAPADDDTTYVESNTVNNKDLYTYGNLSSTPETIYAVVAGFHIKKDLPGSRTGKILCRSNSTDYEGSAIYPGTNYSIFQQIWETDPDTSSAWIEAGINAAEFGIKVES